MRRLSGGLSERGARAADQLIGNGEPSQQQKSEMKRAAAHPGEKVTITFAKAHTVPTHNARTTKVYSVSCPVCSVWSQWSNISSTGQTKQMNRASVATARNILDPTARIMSDGKVGGNRLPCVIDHGLGRLGWPDFCGGPVRPRNQSPSQCSSGRRYHGRVE
jgi:hypothetical protein